MDQNSFLEDRLLFRGFVPRERGHHPRERGVLTSSVLHECDLLSANAERETPQAPQTRPLVRERRGSSHSTPRTRPGARECGEVFCCSRRQQLHPKYQDSERPSGFVRNSVNTNHICTPTKFDVPDAMEPSEFEFEVSLTRNPI